MSRQQGAQKGNDNAAKDHLKKIKEVDPIAVVKQFKTPEMPKAAPIGVRDMPNTFAKRKVTLESDGPGLSSAGNKTYRPSLAPMTTGAPAIREAREQLNRTLIQSEMDSRGALGTALITNTKATVSMLAGAVLTVAKGGDYWDNTRTVMAKMSTPNPKDHAEVAFRGKAYEDAIRAQRAFEEGR
jgi:hypothetical protein